MDLGKKERLEAELEKYQKKLEQMQIDWAASRGGSRYGDEYLETQIKVYKAMIEEVKKELLKA
jgi:cob(I)alamin adenosyltransferase